MPKSEAITGAWISGGLALAGAIIAALVTGGFGLVGSHPAPAPTPTTTSSAPVAVAAANPAAVPASYQGTWNGVVTQANGSAFQLTLKIGSGSVGANVGSWQLPTFNCSGLLTLESGGGPLQLYQETTFNGAGECYAHFTANVTLQGSDLNYEIIGATEVNGQFFAGDPSLASGDLTQG
jgi:hypothetical protein